MSPFLADVQVIRSSGAPVNSTLAAIKPEVRAQVDTVFKTVRFLTDEVLDIAHTATLESLNTNASHIKVSNSDTEAAQARTEAAQARTEAAQAKMEAAQAKGDARTDADSDKDEDGSDNVTIQKDGKSIIVHHAKSRHDEDIPFAVLPIVVVTFVFLYLIVRALMSPFCNRNRRAKQAAVVVEGLSEEEAAVLEKLQRTLIQMESRVESLETILIDQARTKEKYGTKL